MARMLDTREFLDAVCQMLAEGRSTAFLSLPESPLKRGDIVLYQRESGRYILHRIKKVRKDGSLVMVGDAQQELELLLSQNQVRARVVSVIHKGKACEPGDFRWWLYARVWLCLRPFRHFLMALRGK